MRPPPITKLTAGNALSFWRRRADASFWSEHWSSESFDHLRAVAATSEATRFLERHLRPGDRLLEGGCGLGQYVAYFRERGIDAAGVDFSADAVAEHRRRYPDADVRVADLEQLPFDDASFDVYVSLGVIEHYEDGGVTILREAHRVLRPMGTLLLSTPYLSLSRRLLRRRIEREQAAVAAAGGEFYQYAFDHRALDALLGSSGFEVLDRSHYDPGRGWRDIRALLSRGRTRGPDEARRKRAPRPHSRLKRGLLYSRPTLELLAHMQIVAARRT